MDIFKKFLSIYTAVGNNALDTAQRTKDFEKINWNAIGRPV